MQIVMALPKMPCISATDVLSLIPGPNVMIIDVRDEERSKDGHIAGSLHFASKTFIVRFESLLEAVKGKDTAVFYCPFTEGRGSRCAGYLKGYLDRKKVKDSPKNIMVLDGGFSAWRFSGKPVCYCKEIPQCKGEPANIE